MHDKERFNLTLRQAVRLYQQEEDPVPLAYNWYIASAESRGQVWFGKVEVPACRLDGTWYVDSGRFKEAITRHRQDVEHKKQVLRDYEQGIIHGQDGETIEVDWLTYTVRGNFRFVRTELDFVFNDYPGVWYCNKCHGRAIAEYNKEECDLCKNSKGCGTQCTLSKVYCPECGETLEL
ncbi:MAG: hypothetical protein GXX09_01835 [Syntrophomonadaceae bacterium]|nr:hypothetical protein [Syntrophomonadaceae bacterium]